MTVSRKIIIHTTQERNGTTTEHKDQYYSWVQYIILDTEVLNPSLCE